MTVAISTSTAPGSAGSLDLRHGVSFASRQRMAVRDLGEAAALWRLCWKLSWLDILLRYRGSTLGPFWLTLSTAVMVGALGFLNSVLFGMEIRDYLPYLALSLVVWGFISSVVGDACNTFTSAGGMIRSARMPYSLQAVRVVIRNLLVLAHNIVVIVAVDLLLWTWPGGDAVLSIPGFALWLLDGVAVSLLLGAFCARFRDIPPIVGSVMQMAFFISAVMFKPEQLGGAKGLLLLNPFFTILEIVRGPLFGTVPSFEVYASALLYSALLCVVGWLMFVRVRERIAFWV
jgi:lipopolysaccharide transport system permease protein